MISVLGLLISTVLLLTSSEAVASPPSCDDISESMVRYGDPEQVAAELQTTRARVNACAKLGQTRDRLSERREELHSDRRDRGLDP
jgi:hypothetical protein